MLKAFRGVRIALLLLKTGGTKSFLRELKRQIYSTTTYIGVQMNLDKEIVPVPSKITYSLQPASEEDMREVFQKIKTESKKSAVELIYRKRFYESGFHNCYIARTADSNEPCYIQWLLTPEDNNLLSRRSEGRFPKLNEDQILLENRYTFEKYRGNRIAPSVDQQLCEIAKRNGFKQMVAYLAKDNKASWKAALTASHKPFQEVQIRKLFFSTFASRKPYTDLSRS